MKLIVLRNRSETIQGAESLQAKGEVDRSALMQVYGEALSSEWIQIQQEGDPEIRSRALLNLAGREELRGNLAFAREAYTWLQERGNPGAKEKAEERLAVLDGRAAFGSRAEHFLRGFTKEVCDPTMLLAMGVGGVVYKGTRLAAMSRLAGSAGYWGRGLGLRLAGSVAGYAVEAPVFTAVGRLGRGEELLGSGSREELLSSYIVLGALKSMGGLARETSRGLGGVGVQRIAGDAGMYGGIMLGHRLESELGMREWHGGGQEWVDGLAMFVQLKASGHVLNQLGGARYKAMERELEYRSEQLANWNVIPRTANDGGYTRLGATLRIGMVSDPREFSANDGGYGVGTRHRMPMAVGAEVFEVGVREHRDFEFTNPDAIRKGLEVFDMTTGEELGEPGTSAREVIDSSTISEPEVFHARAAAGKEGGRIGEHKKISAGDIGPEEMSRLRELRDKLEGKAANIRAGILGDLLQQFGSSHGELMALEVMKADLENLGDKQSEGYRKICKELQGGYSDLEAELREALRESGEVFRFRWGEGFLQRVEISRQGKARDLELLMEQPSALLLRELHFGVDIELEEFSGMMELEALRQVRMLSLSNGGYDSEYAIAIANSPNIRKVQYLDLSLNQIGEVGASALAASIAFESLLGMDLYNNGIGEAGVRALARSTGLKNLQRLNLGRNGIGEEEATLLRESKGFNNLQLLIWESFD